MKEILFITSIALLTFSQNSFAKQNILQTYEEFAVSTAIIGKCNDPSEADFAKFLANYANINQLASLELQKMYPNKSQNALTMAVKKRSDHIANKTQVRISQVGCDNPFIEAALARFPGQVNWQKPD